MKNLGLITLLGLLAVGRINAQCDCDPADISCFNDCGKFIDLYIN